MRYFWPNWYEVNLKKRFSKLALYFADFACAHHCICYLCLAASFVYSINPEHTSSYLAGCLSGKSGKFRLFNVTSPCTFAMSELHDGDKLTVTGDKNKTASWCYGTFSGFYKSLLNSEIKLDLLKGLKKFTYHCRYGHFCQCSFSKRLSRFMSVIKALYWCHR